MKQTSNTTHGTWPSDQSRATDVLTSKALSILCIRSRDSHVAQDNLKHIKLRLTVTFTPSAGVTGMHGHTWSHDAEEVRHALHRQSHSYSLWGEK